MSGRRAAMVVVGLLGLALASGCAPAFEVSGAVVDPAGAPIANA